MIKEEEIQVALGTAFVCENCQYVFLTKDQYLFSLQNDFDLLINQVFGHVKLDKDAKYCKKCIKALRYIHTKIK